MIFFKLYFILLILLNISCLGKKENLNDDNYILSKDCLESLNTESSFIIKQNLSLSSKSKKVNSVLFTNNSIIYILGYLEANIDGLVYSSYNYSINLFSFKDKINHNNFLAINKKIIKYEIKKYFDNLYGEMFKITYFNSYPLISNSNIIVFYNRKKLLIEGIIIEDNSLSNFNKVYAIFGRVEKFENIFIMK